MRGIVFTTDLKMQVKDFDQPLYETIGKEVGGWIEIVHPEGLDYPLCFVCNEEGLIHHLPLNIFGSVLYGTHKHGSPVVGNIVVMREGMTEDGPDLVDLTDEDIEHVKKLAQEISHGQIQEVEAPDHA